MALSTFVKIGNVTNLSDARYCAGMEVDLIGFNLMEGAESYVNPGMFAQITEWLSGVSYVGEFTGADAGYIAGQLTHYAVDYVQTDDFRLVQTVKNLDRKAILACHVDDLDALPADVQPDFVLAQGDSGEVNDAHLTKILSVKFPVILGFGLTPNNVSTLADSGIYGIALQGSEEIKPGYKDYDTLANILENLEIED